MKITKLGEYCGAEVTDIDLREPQDAATIKALNDALSEHVAIVVRDQDFTPQQYVEAGKLFGNAFPQNFTDLNHPDAPLINIVSNQHTDKDGKTFARGDRWHTDHTNHECPPKCTVLYAIELPDEGGPTAICPMHKVYETLPDDLRAKVDGRETVNVNLGRASPRSSPKAIEAEKRKKSVPINHPLVRTHPENGRKALYFHPIKTDYVTGYTPEETKELLADIMMHGIKEEYVYYHQWRKGDMLVWDNRQALHRAVHNYDPS
jgi:taurine dioxygenase